MKILNSSLLVLLFLSIIACNSSSSNADSVETVETVKATNGQHKASIKEVLQTSVYTYLFVEEHSESFWVACNRQEFSEGQTVYFMDGLAMENFESKELSRTFDLVYFLNAIAFEPGSLIESAAGASSTPHGMIKEAVKKEINVEKAEGGISLGELFANPASFNGQTVTIRGEVVKYNEAIMGKNWVHIQDGSGTGESFDLTVTTTGVVKVGDVVTFTGTINLNKDFGAGYVYEVIMEEAKIITKI